MPLMPTTKQFDELRASHTFTAVKEMEDRGKKSRLREIQKTSQFSLSELETIAAKFSEVSPNNDFVDFNQFEILLREHMPWWKFDPLELFKLLDKKKNGSIEFSEYANALSILCKGSLEEQMNMCFKLYDGDNDDHISKDEFEYARTVMYSLLLRNREILNQQFKQADQDSDSKLSLNEFKKAIQDPLWK